ncbi:hypothetical protein BLNAU_256 [Blattamonas nauphoetae]|uniref:Uncharacterized protein n=1 Tax=Blattamonas nauphoetae TaxID=2049346 RepID=A0ABQ9YMQ8_9EUKA|nr:hypothetical protein BLNAU_256 [Blattamonas nauphoetae]
MNVRRQTSVANLPQEECFDVLDLFQTIREHEISYSKSLYLHELQNIHEKLKNYTDPDILDRQINLMNDLQTLLKAIQSYKSAISMTLRRVSSPEWISVGNTGKEEFNTLLKHVNTFVSDTDSTLATIRRTLQLVSNPDKIVFN